MQYAIADDPRFAALLVQARQHARTLQIARLAALHGSIHPDLAAARQLLVLVQEWITYERDAEEDWQGPVLAWQSGRGDCDDSAVLLAALYLARGWPVRLVAYGKKVPTHVSVQVYVAGAWRWAEPTIRAELGEEPAEAMKRLRREA